MSTILIAEDSDGIASFVEKGLRANGYVTLRAVDGPTAVRLALDDAVDLLILDIGLPGMDGFEVLRTIRSEGVTIPVIILTARGSVDDTVAGLEGGADDYMAKPFAFAELLARIRLRLRVDPATTTTSVLAAGDLALDLHTRRARVDGRDVDLSAREFALAEMFLRHPDQVLSREQLLDGVWGFDFDPGSNVTDVYVRYLRRKIGDERIETVRGMGYRLRVDTTGPDA